MKSAIGRNKVIGLMFELRVPFFKPMWRRILTVILFFGWGTVEFVNAATLWAIGFYAMGALGAYQFFFAWRDPEEPSDED